MPKHTPPPPPPPPRPRPRVCPPPPVPPPHFRLFPPGQYPGFADHPSSPLAFASGGSATHVCASAQILLAREFCSPSGFMKRAMASSPVFASSAVGVG